MAAHAADVVVIGAGLAGLAAAAGLASSGARIVVLERAAHLGAGASGRAIGAGFLGLHEHPWRLEASLGAVAFASLLDLSRASLRALGTLAGATTGGIWRARDDREADELARDAAALERAGLACHHDGHALHLPDETSFEAEDVLGALSNVVTRNGGEVRTGWAVRGVDDDGPRPRVVSDRGALSADVIVYAAGAWCRHLDGFFTDTVVPTREAAIVVPPGTPHPTAVMRSGSGWTRWREAADGLRIEGNRWATPHLEVGETDDSTADPRVIARLAEAARGLGRTATPAPARAFLVAGTCDGLPLVGPLPGRPRHVALVGFQGNDAGLALAAAAGVVDGLLTGRSSVPPLVAAARMGQ